ncbi:MAG: NAD(P)/FAD-dependent oxidoreductase [Vicinamibacterales bacterium]
MKIAIVGGGIMGMTLGYVLASRGLSVHVFEQSAVLGGLAGPTVLEDGTEVDRFYHAILSSDDHLRSLCEELGIADQLRFRPTRTGVFIRGGMHQMSNIWQFLTFSALRPVDRLRLGLTIFSAQRTREWQSLETQNLEQYLIARGGRQLFQDFWKPMLNAKFDGQYGNVPATWMWSRFVRTASSRSGVQKQELTGHLIGGYATLMKAMADGIIRRGGQVHLQTTVREIVMNGPHVAGVRLDGDVRPYDQVVVTAPMPVAARLMPGAPPAYLDDLTAFRYLGIVCPLLVLSRPLSEYWVTNIADSSVPLTGVIETTAYIDPQYVGGHHLVYAPKYTAPDSRWMRASDQEIRSVWLSALKRIFPTMEPDTVRQFVVHRERLVEPLREAGSTRSVPSFETPIEGLHLVTTAQIYPALTNGESVTRHARGAAAHIVEALGRRTAAASPRPAA